MSARDWLALGLIGQFLFSARFVVQWIYSERHHRSFMPMAFWYLSVAGGTILLAYAAYQRDPVFVVGQTGGLAIYLRNVQLRLRELASHGMGVDG
ncbi:MAG: lipid-A-disaccharide synthase N-terminal domain-containing protein [Proteobacteria bacterium]|nr:lipid-A-disaccharide synthase N-terminal domain-containing protein [Pseudomonadota bacterium]